MGRSPFSGDSGVMGSREAAGQFCWWSPESKGYNASGEPMRMARACQAPGERLERKMMRLATNQTAREARKSPMTHSPSSRLGLMPRPANLRGCWLSPKDYWTPRDLPPNFNHHRHREIDAHSLTHRPPFSSLQQASQSMHPE